jgi:hypothetical protein
MTPDVGMAVVTGKPFGFQPIFILTAPGSAL